MGAVGIQGTFITSDETSTIIEMQRKALNNHRARHGADANSWYTGEINTIDNFDFIREERNSNLSPAEIQNTLYLKATYLEKGNGIVYQCNKILGYDIYHFEETKVKLNIHSDELSRLAPTSGFTVINEWYGPKLKNSVGTGAKREFWSLEEAKEIAYRDLKHRPAGNILIIGVDGNCIRISSKVRRVKENTQHTEIGLKTVLPVHRFYYVALAFC